jgi:hypothetical protein
MLALKQVNTNYNANNYCANNFSKLYLFIFFKTYHTKKNIVFWIGLYSSFIARTKFTVYYLFKYCIKFIYESKFILQIKLLHDFYGSLYFKQKDNRPSIKLVDQNEQQKKGKGTFIYQL